MLESTQDPPTTEAGWVAPAAEAHSASLAGLVPFIKGSARVIAWSTAITMALGAIYVITTPPGYVATAQIMIEPGKQQALWRDNSVIDLTVDNAQVESQVEVLRSERIANDVINALDLTKDPEFRGETAADRDAPPDRGSANDKGKGGSAADFERKRIVLARFLDALSARRIGQSYVIEVSFRSKDPEKAARITNAITAEYIHDQLQAKADVARQASDWMEGRITALAQQLNNAAGAVQRFRAANGILDTPGSSSQPRLISQLTELEARAQAYRKLFESFLQKLTENRQQETYPVSNTRVIAAASRPLVKSDPKSTLVMAFAAILGIMLGIGIAAARSALDGTVRSAQQIRGLGGLDCVGMLPRYRAARGRGSRLLRRIQAMLIPAWSATDRDPNDIPAADYEPALEDPLSPFTEALRSIKIHIQNTRQTKARCLGIVSLSTGGGASTLATSLATLFSASGSKTLLIDGDLRAASISRRLAASSSQGLFEALRGDLEDAILFEPKRRIHLLPVHDPEATFSSADLLGSAEMQRLLLCAGQRYETVIVDLPPLSRVADARAIGPLLDSCILVLEWGCTPLDTLKETIELLRAERISVLGVVINKVKQPMPRSLVSRIATSRAAELFSYVDQPLEGVSE